MQLHSWGSLPLVSDEEETSSLLFILEAGQPTLLWWVVLLVQALLSRIACARAGGGNSGHCLGFPAWHFDGLILMESHGVSQNASNPGSRAWIQVRARRTALVVKASLFLICREDFLVLLSVQNWWDRDYCLSGDKGICQLAEGMWLERTLG